MQDINKLQVGDTLQLQYAPPSTNQERFAVRVIGYLLNESIVTTTPMRAGKVMLIREGMTFTIRLLQGDAVLGFNAKVLHSATKPYPHIHLAYPDDVETKVVRNAQRVNSNLKASVRNTQLMEEEEQYHKVTLVDISLTGARLECRELLGKVGDVLHINAPLRVCESEEFLRTLVNVCSVTPRETEDGERVYYYGVAFRMLSRIQKLLLCAYVKGQIAHS
ncbi:MAG: flagellar brake protein [Candidatus Polarisedimenticolaceae bacterium]|nr:flagellar brake protein [Candidatus Polarisedimenticolaceae bacterium]